MGFRLITPRVTLDVIKSMKDLGDKTGVIPAFFHGDHGASSIAGIQLFYKININDWEVLRGR